MNNYSYITLLSDDSYIYGVILLRESLKQVQSLFPLHILVTSNVTPPIINILEQLELNYSIIEPIYDKEIAQFNRKVNPKMAKTWAFCLSKFDIFKMTEYDKLIFLDADIMLLKNIDDLFECPHMTSALDGEMFNLWPENPHFNSGILVIKPDKEEYNNLMQFTKEKALAMWTKQECLADLEILNLYYSDWFEHSELHLNKYYDIFAPYIQESLEEDININGLFIHFIGRKPWRAFQKNPLETYSELYYTQARELIMPCINAINWDQVKDKIKIAIYGICKNEILNIEKYLACFHKADYLCILDTGSTDGTWEYLQKAQQIYPNLIIDQKIVEPWRYDTARNISLSLVPKDTTMFFMMDLDEIIKLQDWTYLMKTCWDPMFSRGTYIYHRFVDESSDTPIHTFREHRIHNNSWHYEGIVHELLCNEGGTRVFYIDECIEVPITVWHYPTEKNKKTYIQLCELGVKEEPNNWIMHLLLAAEYEVHELYENAINEYKKIILEADNLASLELGRCYASLGRALVVLGEEELGMQMFKKGRASVPDYGDNYFIAADILYQKKEFIEAYNLCLLGIAMSGDNAWCSIVDKNGYFPYVIMGLSQFYLGNEILGLGYLAVAREKNKNEEISHIYDEILTEIMTRR